MATRMRSAIMHIGNFNRATHGTNETAQCFDLYCELTMEKLDCNLGVFNRCLYQHLVKDISELRHGDDFATLATRTQIDEFKEVLSKHFLVRRRIATLGPRQQLLDSWSRTISECATVDRQNLLRSKLFQDTQSC